MAFAIAGSRLVQRIRLKAFSCLLRQEVAYFDRPENSSGAISTRLSSDALAIQQMTGSRIGMICEAFALFLSGLLFGLILSWQLTIIAFIPLTILTVVTYLSIRLHMWFSQQISTIHERASSVRSYISILLLFITG
jgi:ATP-binding cassette subfamily B (MDR/TAP) protein 1